MVYKSPKQYIVFAFCILSFIFGILVEFYFGKALRHSLIPRDNYQKGLAHREVVDWAQLNRDSLLVLFTAGQSHASSHVRTRYYPRNEVFTLYGNKIYKTEDPLLNACGRRGSIWSRLADMLIDSNVCHQVVLVNTASGGSSIKDWAYNKAYKHKLDQAFNDLRVAQLSPDYILWIQGQKDNVLNTPKDEYIRAFDTLKSNFGYSGITAPFIMAVSTYSPTAATFVDGRGLDTSIQSAQLEIIENYNDVFQGPWLDSLILASHRHDGLHLSDLAAEILVQHYFSIIKDQLNKHP